MVWTGDVQGIKQRTLSRWGPQNCYKPLKVSVYESLFGTTLVMIALRHKRFDLAKLLLQIAQAQYRPKDDKVNYYVDRNNSECGSDSGADGLDYFVVQETFDNTFELGDVTRDSDFGKEIPFHEIICESLDGNRWKIPRLSVLGRKQLVEVLAGQRPKADTFERCVYGRF